MQPALDLSKYHFVKDLGEISLYGTWVTTDPDDEPEPCLCLVRNRDLNAGNATPCCVVLGNAYLYYEPSTGHSYLLQTARSFIRPLGLMDNMQNVHKVADAIMDHLQDLIELPPKPGEQNRDAGAEVTITDSSGREITRELYEDS